MTGDGQVEFGVRACDRLRTHYGPIASCKAALRRHADCGVM